MKIVFPITKLFAPLVGFCIVIILVFSLGHFVNAEVGNTCNCNGIDVCLAGTSCPSNCSLTAASNCEIPGTAPSSNLWKTATNWITGQAAEVTLKASAVISVALGSVVSLIIYIEGLIIDYLLSPNFSFTKAPVVEIGWKITRDLANMFFILILLIIAFATVLRIERYALKQLLWKVVVAALLINFSLVMAGIVIDFTQVLTKFFVNGITGGSGSFTTKFMFNMNINNFYKPTNDLGSVGTGLANLGESMFAAIAGILLTLIAGVVLVFVFGATAIFLILRIINIWGLLIVAPIAWILWILPNTSGHFQKWWDSFIKWAFFAPIYTFFMFLATKIFDNQGMLSGTFIGTTPTGWNTSGPGLTVASMPSAIFQFILVIAIMFYALIYAKSFGIMGANATFNTLKGFGDKSKNWAGRQLRRGALAVGAQKAEVDAAGKVIKPAQPGWVQRGAEKVAAWPGGKLLTGAVFKQVEAEAKSLEDAQKQFANWSDQAIKNYLKTPGGTTTARLAAALALKDKGKLGDRGKPGDLNEDQTRELIELAARYSPKNVEKLLEVVPHLALEFGKKIEDIVKKIEKAEQISIESLSRSEVVLNLNPTQLKDIALKANAAKVQAVRNTAETAYNNLMASDPTLEMMVEEDIINEPNKDVRNRNMRRLDEKERKVVGARFITTASGYET